MTEIVGETVDVIVDVTVLLLEFEGVFDTVNELVEVTVDDIVDVVVIVFDAELLGVGDNEAV